MNGTCVNGRLRDLAGGDQTAAPLDRAAVTLTYSANVITVYSMAHDKRNAPFSSRHDPWMTAAAVVNVALLLWTLSEGLRAAEGSESRLARQFRRSRERTPRLESLGT